MSDVLVIGLRNYAETADYHTDAAFFDKAANRIEADAKLIQEMREALEECVGLLEVIKEDWIDYDHIYSIHVHETKLLISKAKSQQEG